MSTRKPLAESTQKALDKAIENINRYTKADEELVRSIIVYLGIAARSRDGSLVSCSSKSELNTVRENFLKKKLGLKESDAKLDKAIAEVCEEMQGDRQKLRATFYYLLVKKFGKESLFA